MRLLLAAVVALLLLAGFGLFLYATRRLYRRMQRALDARGYRSPVVQTGSGALAFALTLGGFFAVAAVAGAEAALPAIFVAAMAAPLILTACVRLLPARQARTAGARVVRFPYRRASYALYAAAVLAVGGAAALELGNLLSVAAMLTVAGLTCREIARRTTLPDASVVLAADSRPPVLYLRPFEQDDRVFAELPRMRGQFWTDLGRNIARTSSRRHLTLDEYLRDAIARIGPWVALGNPSDFVPPEGAARSYIADAEWQDRFRTLAAQAACCVMIAGVSSSIRWELAALRAMALHQRLFLLTPPRRPRGARLTRLLTTPPRRQPLPLVAWPDVAAALREAGYQPDAGAPGPGAVVGFDAEGRSWVLAREATSPAAVVDAIARALAAGRGVPVRV
jgi:hypothetical protein